ncbi:hypothetical protein ACWD5R_37230 [Streptomyces sp. NPDC002514]|uniref:hypothetical protein n=1 Tax=unclassified Streptomyces TaxID=2593676 RepID=UPI0036CF0F48
MDGQGRTAGRPGFRQVTGAPVYQRRAGRRRIQGPVRRWYGRPTRADETVPARCVNPVLDAGCGPGRLCGALLGRGVFALGFLALCRHASAPLRRGEPAARWRGDERVGRAASGPGQAGCGP